MLDPIINDILTDFFNIIKTYYSLTIFLKGILNISEQTFDILSSMFKSKRHSLKFVIIGIVFCITVTDIIDRIDV